MDCKLSLYPLIRGGFGLILIPPLQEIACISGEANIKRRGVGREIRDTVDGKEPT